MFARKSSAKLLEAAQRELSTAEAKVEEIARAEGDALESNELHVAWRRQRDDAAAEVDRLKRLVAKIEADIAEEDRKAAEAAQRKLEADAEAGAERTAALIRKNLAEMGRLTREMMEAIARSDLAVASANVGRSPELPRIATAESQARGGQDKPERIISQRNVQKWTFSETGEVLGDEQAQMVRVGQDGRGSLLAQSAVHPVILRKFRQVTFIPAERAPYVKELAKALAVPGVAAGDPPAWMPLDYSSPNAILRQLEQFSDRSTTSEKPEVRFELIEEEATESEEAA